MKGNKSIAIILLLAGLALGIMGVNKYNNSGGSVDVLGAELSVKDNTGRNSAYMYIGLGVLSFLGGMYMYRKG